MIDSRKIDAIAEARRAKKTPEQLAESRRQDEAVQAIYDHEEQASKAFLKYTSKLSKEEKIRLYKDSARNAALIKLFHAARTPAEWDAYDSMSLDELLALAKKA